MAPAEGNGTVTFEGSFLGQPEPPYETGAGCAVLTHHLDAAFTVAGGAAWRLHEDYCGTVSPSGLWSGQGTFTIDTGDGTFTGTFTSRAQLPTTGEPYVLDITDATGSLTGATGRCTLDNHIRDVAPSSTQQHGTFTCTISPNGASIG